MTTTRYSPRDHSLDALRTLAVIGMMAAHTARLMPFDVRPSWARLVLLLEPLIPSLFLFLVGASLALSFRAARRRLTSPALWYRRQLARAAALWALSSVFFALEMGVRLPDMFLAGGILANIAYAIALIGGLLAATHARTHDAATFKPAAAGSALALTLGAGTLVFVALDVTGTRIHPVNIGNSPFLPLWLFAFAGALWGTTNGGVEGTGKGQDGGGEATAPKTRMVVVGLIGIVGLVGAVAAAALVARYGLDALFTKPLGRSDATRLVPAPVYGGAPLEVGYYNLRPVLALACLGVHLAVLAALGPVLRALTRARKNPSPESPRPTRRPVVFALGRHALGAYITHLALLALLVVALGERQPLPSGALGTLVLAGLILICQSLAILRERHK